MKLVTFTWTAPMHMAFASGTFDSQIGKEVTAIDVLGVEHRGVLRHATVAAGGGSVQLTAEVPDGFVVGGAGMELSATGSRSRER